MPTETFATLVNRKLLVPSARTAYVAVQRDYLVALMAPALATIHLDSAWYLAHSPDVAAAIDRGEFASAADHFVRVGYFEHRMPYPIDIDEPWYLAQYPDVAAAVRAGVFPTARAHFYQDGYREGRYPHPNFALRAAGPPDPVVDTPAPRLRPYGPSRPKTSLKRGMSERSVTHHHVARTGRPQGEMPRA